MIEIEFQSMLDQRLLELRSFRFKINEAVQFKHDKTKYGYIVERQVHDKKRSGVAITTYAVRIFQQSWTTLNHDTQDHPEDYDISNNVRQEELESTDVTRKLATFQSFPTVPKLNASMKAAALELLSIQACSARAAAERKMMKLHILNLAEGEIGEEFDTDDISIENVMLETLLQRALTRPKKLLNKQAGRDVQQNIKWYMKRTQLAGAGADANANVGVDDASSTATSTSTKTATQTATSTATQTNSKTATPTSTSIDETSDETILQQKLRDLNTLKLQPPPPHSWKWPCQKDEHSLRVQIDAFVDKAERSFSTIVSVDNPILSILHFFRCWYLFSKDEETNMTAGYLNSMELYIKIRTHAHEQVVRVDTLNQTSNQVVRDAFKSAWDLVHRSGSMEIGMEINVSCICQNMIERPSLCVSIRVQDIENDPIIRVSLPVGVSLVHARQLIEDCVTRVAGHGGGDEEDDGNNDDDEQNCSASWRKLQALAASNEYTFSKQGASVVRSAEWKISALELSVIEGSRVFYRHSQSEELSLVCLPTSS